MTRKRLTSEERRIQILEAALEIFSQKGFSGARTKEIAKAAGISETLIFQHFKTKEQLYTEALHSLFDHHPVLPELEDHLARDDDEGVLFALAKHIIEHGRKDPRIVRLVIFSGLEKSSPGKHAHMKRRNDGEEVPEKEVARYLERRMKAGAFKPGDPDVAARLFLYMVFQIIADHHLSIIEEPLRLSDEEAARAVVDLFLNGLRGQNKRAV